MNSGETSADMHKYYDWICTSPCIMFMFGATNTPFPRFVCFHAKGRSRSSLKVSPELISSSIVIERPDLWHR